MSKGKKNIQLRVRLSTIEKIELDRLTREGYNTPSCAIRALLHESAEKRSRFEAQPTPPAQAG